MKCVYPAVFTKLEEGGYMAYVPDLTINTQGETLAEAIEMARDAISLVCVDMEDEGRPLPSPSEHIVCGAAEVVSFVDADLVAYRRAIEKRSVCRNVSLLLAGSCRRGSRHQCFRRARQRTESGAAAL